ncbi:hypothetical protein PV11_03453 [Exophiala sideris]|uniref:Uncharacterized protein n=1 Tax=Exophiala sideris TaxID=1016849 RepID=A0A0D1Z2Y4_9EURO|nr:hypothetical protein PV11_03453 [Exophiala sideris]
MAHQSEPNTEPRVRQTQDDGAARPERRKSLLHNKGFLRKRSSSDSAQQHGSDLNPEEREGQSAESQSSSKHNLWKFLPHFGKANREHEVSTPGGNPQDTT